MIWELNFMRWANGRWSSSVLDQVLPWLTYLGSHFAVILFILLSWILTRQRKLLRCLILLYAVQSAVVYGLKFLVKRERPLFFLEMASKLSKRPCCFFFYDGDPPLELVPSLSNPFLHCRCIHRMDSNLFSPSLSHGCRRRSCAGIRIDEGLFILFSTFFCAWNPSRSSLSHSRLQISETASVLVSCLTNKLNKKDQRRSGGDIGIGLLRGPFVADEYPLTGEHSPSIRAYGYCPLRLHDDRIVNQWRYLCPT
jgi:hypothetical protein